MSWWWDELIIELDHRWRVNIDVWLYAMDRRWTNCTILPFHACVLFSRAHWQGLQNFKMAPINVDNKKRMAVFSRILRERSRRRALQQSVIITSLRRRTMLKAYLLTLLLLLYDKVVASREARRRQRSCRRLPRNAGWWDNVKDHYSNARFKKTFRISRETFSFILERIKHDIEKKSLTEEPIPRGGSRL